MKPRTASRALLITVLAFAGVLDAVVRADEPVGTDGDNVPAGLTPDEEAAWVFAHSPVVHVVSVRP